MEYQNKKIVITSNGNLAQPLKVIKHQFYMKAQSVLISMEEFNRIQWNNGDIFEKKHASVTLQTNLPLALATLTPREIYHYFTIKIKS